MEPKIVNFERSALESDMKRLAVEVEKHRATPENENLGDREIIKQSLRTVTKLPPPPPPPPGGSAPTTPTPLSLPAYIEASSAETKLEVEYLLDLALREGIAKATNEAEKSSAFVLDAFHDTLVKLYEDLAKSGKLQ